MSKFTIGSQWKTRGGWRAIVVRIPRFDGEDFVCFHDMSYNEIDTYRHFEDGRYAGHSTRGRHDLIEPWQEPVVHEGWINVHKLYTEMYFYNRRENADADKDEGNSERIACIKIKFTEGEGL